MKSRPDATGIPGKLGQGFRIQPARLAWRVEGEIMQSILGIFESRTTAEKAVQGLLATPISPQSIIFLSGEAGQARAVGECRSRYRRQGPELDRTLPRSGLGRGGFARHRRVLLPARQLRQDGPCRIASSRAPLPDLERRRFAEGNNQHGVPSSPSGYARRSKPARRENAMPRACIWRRR